MEELDLTPDLDIDLQRPNVTARCPFSCPGRYVAGYHQRGGLPFVVHSLPHCDRFATTSPVQFVRDARMAGAQTRRVESTRILQDHGRKPS
jgi:hypothetical protein